MRDAAAYVCWAFARAYSPEALGATGGWATLHSRLAGLRSASLRSQAHQHAAPPGHLHMPRRACPPFTALCLQWSRWPPPSSPPRAMTGRSTAAGLRPPPSRCRPIPPGVLVARWNTGPACWHRHSPHAPGRKQSRFSASLCANVVPVRPSPTPPQECVGRLGSFPHGIEILTTADYFTVSVRQNVSRLGSGRFWSGRVWSGHSAHTTVCVPLPAISQFDKPPMPRRH